MGEWANEYLTFARQRFSSTAYTEKCFAFREFFLSEAKPETPIASYGSKAALVHLQYQARKRSGSSANRQRKNLRAAWEWGVKFLGLPERNPFHVVPRFAEIRYERSVPTLEEFWKVYAAAEFEKDRLMLFAYLQTGARRDELFRLKWIDVDFTKKRLRLRWRKNSIGEWRESWLPVGDELLDMLKVQRKTTGKLEFVFMRCTDDGQWVPYEARGQWLKRLCKRAGVKDFGFHGIRHLFASILASKNVPLVEIQKMLRHGSIQTTARYIHSLQDGSREALEALPKLEDQSVWKVFEQDVRKNEKPTDNPHWRVGVCLRASEQSLSN
ncbi:integrase [Desulfofustis limnaeus]|uniref:Integrase n=1 Tax=Desulfofustis limnaeus TaxID=2740163 RepID=A0ABM7W7Y2_9BACT|nr:integrase [Desulfofustis limnaeus]